MHLYVTGRHFALTEAIHDYVQRRLVGPVESHANSRDVQRMEIQLYETGEGGDKGFGCHVMLQLPAQQDINIRDEASSLYEAIDSAEKRLLRQLHDHRDRRITGRHAG
ncbi:MAG TPA: ribosome-associated translation inhibitor RaiA [Polyangiaceae bacterium]|nr:ribosome-associated translation inhibitor RaiA [Polyangiaceae bacterium]